MDPVDTHKHIRRLHLYIFALTVVVLGLVWFLFKDQLGIVKKEEPTPAPQVEVKKENRGTMTLQSRTRAAAVGGQYVVQVVADSDAEDIVGFDVLLAFDQDAFNVSSVTSPLAGYRVVSTPQEGYLAVTGVQDPQNTVRNVFKNSVILEVALSPKLEGDYDIVILLQSGNADSKLVTTQTNILLPAVESLSVSVQ